MGVVASGTSSRSNRHRHNQKLPSSVSVVALRMTCDMMRVVRVGATSDRFGATCGTAAEGDHDGTAGGKRQQIQASIRKDNGVGKRCDPAFLLDPPLR